MASSSVPARWPSTTAGRPLTSSSFSGGRAPRASAATGLAMVECRASSIRHSARSASLPGSMEPISSARPRQRAPPMVAACSACRAVSAAGPRRARANSSAAWTSGPSWPVSLEAAPSTPRPTGAPAARSSGTGAIPAPSRALDVGQCATPVPVSPRRSIARSSRCTQCASQTSAPVQPRESRNSVGVTPNFPAQNCSSSTVSEPWVCSRTPRRRASSAAPRSSSPVTVNGEHGATLTRTIASGAGS